MERTEIALDRRVRSSRVIRVALGGLGPIGISVAKALADRPRFEVVTAVDPGSGVTGQSLSKLTGGPNPDHVRVLSSFREVTESADVAVLATGSALGEVAPLIEELLSRKLHVVSTCEELFHPGPDAVSEVERLDGVARRVGRAVVAGGINPGFAMDVLPLTLATTMLRVDAVEVSRVLDARTRRLPFQRKVCVGEDLQTARERIEAGKAGHVGLLNSALFLAERFGFGVDRAVRELRPVIADRPLSGPIEVGRGKTAGLEENLVLYEGDRARITFRLVMAAGASPVEDRVRLAGEPSVESTVSGGFPGDESTAAEIVNLIGPVADAAPGFRSPADLALPWFP